jgi:hypothetical protein
MKLETKSALLLVKKKAPLRGQQKNAYSLGVVAPAAPAAPFNKSSLLPFSKKEALAFLCTTKIPITFAKVVDAGIRRHDDVGPGA